MKNYLKGILCLFLLFISGKTTLSQYAPQVGNAGSTAIHKDSSVFSADAFSGIVVAELKRGWQNIADTQLGFATVGSKDTFDARPGNGSMISLGDGGSLILQLAYEAYNGPGPDFVIFENGFPFSQDSFFLELAFVEVSADGSRYYRFPAHSVTDTTQQVGPFGSLKAERLYNLAGKFVFPYGTPFDLEELKDSMPVGQLNNIRFIRLVDVVGSVQSLYGSRDANQRLVNDPWPTPFPSSGFDLSGIGVIHAYPVGLSEKITNQVSVYPNPARTGDKIYLSLDKSPDNIWVQDISGKSIETGPNQLCDNTWEMEAVLKPGIYMIRVQTREGFLNGKICIQP